MMKSCWWRTTREVQNKMMIEDESLYTSSSPIRTKWDRQTQYMPKTSNQQQNQRKKKKKKKRRRRRGKNVTRNLGNNEARKLFSVSCKTRDAVIGKNWWWWTMFQKKPQKRWWNWTREETNWLCNHHSVMMRMTWSVYFWTCRQSSLFPLSLNRVYWTVTEIFLLQSTLLYQDNHHRITSNKDK